jgi:hypothetical protein
LRPPLPELNAPNDDEIADLLGLTDERSQGGPQSGGLPPVLSDTLAGGSPFAATSPLSGSTSLRGPNFPVPTTSAVRREMRDPQYLDETSYVLARALGIQDTSWRALGWIQNSFTGNPGVPNGAANFGVNPNHLANQWMGNQYYFILGRRVQPTDTINFGFRLDLLFGNDWQFNHMHGLFDSAFHLNSFLGFDPANFYATVHLPILTERGMDIRGGRFYTIAGYEGVPAISRPLLSVPYMFNYGQPFTHFGMLSILHLSDNLDLFNGAINGWDRWVDQNYRWGYIGGLSYTSDDARDHFALTGIWGPNQFPRFLPANTQLFPAGYVNIPSLAGLPNPGYDRNDRSLLTWVYSHHWTEKLVQTIETDQGWERKIPGLASGGLNYAPRSDEWYSFGNWFLYSVNDSLTGVWRSEWFRDVAGSRTGFAGNFYEITLGMVIKPKPWISIRPEVRFDWSQFCHPFDNGTKSQQLTLGTDVIFRF